MNAESRIFLTGMQEKDKRETERVDTENDTNLQRLTCSTSMCFSYFILNWTCQMFSFVYHNRVFQALSCHFRLSSEPQKILYNAQITPGITMCHSICHGESCFERQVKWGSICASTCAYQQFKCFSLCAKCKQQNRTGKKLNRATNEIIRFRNIFFKPFFVC